MTARYKRVAQRASPPAAVLRFTSLRPGAWHIRSIPVRLVAIASTLAAACLLALPGTTLADRGDLSFLECFELTGTGTACTDVVALDRPNGIVVSPDGMSAYVTSIGGVFSEDGAVVTFDRAADGTLTFRECFEDAEGTTACTNVPEGLSDARRLALSPDGESLYVVSFGDNTLVSFDRADDGSLTFAECFQDDDAASGTECTEHAGLSGTSDVAVSGDGASVYVTTDTDHSLLHFTRVAGGALTFDECFADAGSPLVGCAEQEGLGGAFGVDVSPGGASVLVTSRNDDALLNFDRDPDGTLAFLECFADTGQGTPACAEVAGLEDATAVVVSPGGDSVYAAASDDDAVVSFARAADGTLSPLGCLANAGAGTSCATAPGLDGADELAVSPDGASVYVVGRNGDTLAHLERASSGALSFSACFGVAGPGVGCSLRAGLDDARGVAVSPDGTSVYAAGAGSDTLLAFARDPDDPPPTGDGGGQDTGGEPPAPTPPPPAPPTAGPAPPAAPDLIVGRDGAFHMRLEADRRGNVVATLLAPVRGRFTVNARTPSQSGRSPLSYRRRTVAARAGREVSVVLRPTEAIEALLRRTRRPVKVTGAVTFRPDGGTAVTKRETVRVDVGRPRSIARWIDVTFTPTLLFSVLEPWNHGGDHGRAVYSGSVGVAAVEAMVPVGAEVPKALKGQAREVCAEGTAPTIQIFERRADGTTILVGAGTIGVGGAWSVTAGAPVRGSSVMAVVGYPTGPLSVGGTKLERVQYRGETKTVFCDGFAATQAYR